MGVCLACAIVSLLATLSMTLNQSIKKRGVSFQGKSHQTLESNELLEIEIFA